MLYLYKTILYHNTDGVLGVPSTNTADLSDYSTNHQSSTVKADNIENAETSIIISKTYSQFDALVVSPYDWSDVKEVTKEKAYELYIITEAPL